MSGSTSLKWNLEFQIYTVADGQGLPFLFLRRFPLALYLLWVTCADTFLGRRLEYFRLFGWSMDKWLLEFPLTLPRAVLATGSSTRVICLDICLGRVNPIDIITDLSSFFRCQVILLPSIFTEPGHIYTNSGVPNSFGILFRSWVWFPAAYPMWKIFSRCSILLPVRIFFLERDLVFPICQILAIHFTGSDLIFRFRRGLVIPTGHGGWHLRPVLSSFVPWPEHLSLPLQAGYLGWS